MDARGRARIAIPVAIVAAVAAAGLLVGLSFPRTSTGPASGAECCPPGAPSAQPTPLLLQMPNGTFPVPPHRTVNFTVLAADTGLVAGNLQFLPETGQQLVTNEPLAIVVWNANGTEAATYNSSLSGWDGQDTGSFGGWPTGTAAAVQEGEAFSVTFSGPASWLYGYGFLGCGSGLVSFQFP